MKEKILEQAVALFNEKGIEYVGMRELAAALGVKLGNITYYFPTKEDLIRQVAVQLSERNAGVMRPDGDITLQSFLEMLRRQFRNQVQYRCLLLSFVHLIRNYESMAERYGQIETARRSAVRENIGFLIANKQLKALQAEERAFLDAQLALNARFWISEAAVSYRGLDPEAQIGHYLRLIARLLMPYATAKGRQDLEAFLS